MRITFLRKLLLLSLLLFPSMCVGSSKINLDELSQQIINSYESITRMRVAISALAVQKEHISQMQDNIKFLLFETPSFPLTKSVWSAQKELELYDLREKYSKLLDVYLPAQKLHASLLDKHFELTRKEFPSPAPKACKFSTTRAGCIYPKPPSSEYLLRIANQNCLLPVQFLDKTGENPCQLELVRPNRNPQSLKVKFIEITSVSSSEGLTRTESSFDFEEFQEFEENDINISD